MFEWDSLGYNPSRRCSDPNKLSDYVQGKKCRDWHITEWKSGIEDGLFIPEEFLGTLGCNEKEFESIFGRKPRKNILGL